MLSRVNQVKCGELLLRLHLSILFGGGVVFSEVPSSPMIPAGNFCWTFTTEGGKEVSGAQEPPVTAETESV